MDKEITKKLIEKNVKDLETACAQQIKGYDV